MEMLVATLSALVVQIPVILVWLCGVILALVFWKRHPQVSALTMIAILGLMVMALINAYLGMWLPTMLQDRGLPLTQIGVVLLLRSVITEFLSAVLWGCLVAAIFGWRKLSDTAR